MTIQGTTMKNRAKHNKKRNVALIYEQLVRYVSKSLIEGRHDRAKIAMKIVKEHFAKDTQLYKEFRLFNALLRTTVTDKRLADRILSEAREAAKAHDTSSLDREKGKLINSINRELNEAQFYDMRVPEYRDLATVQTLLNEWRKGHEAHIPTVASYEEKTVEILMTPKHLPELLKSENVNGLSVKIMKDKVAKKFGGELNETQLGLVMSAAKGDSGTAKKLMQRTKTESIRVLENFKRINNNEVLDEKITPVIESIRSLDENDASDGNIAKYLLLSNLTEEIVRDDNGK